MPAKYSIELAYSQFSFQLHHTKWILITELTNNFDISYQFIFLYTNFEKAIQQTSSHTELSMHNIN